MQLENENPKQIFLSSLIARMARYGDLGENSALTA